MGRAASIASQKGFECGVHRFSEPGCGSHASSERRSDRSGAKVIRTSRLARCTIPRGGSFAGPKGIFAHHDLTVLRVVSRRSAGRTRLPCEPLLRNRYAETALG